MIYHIQTQRNSSLNHRTNYDYIKAIIIKAIIIKAIKILLIQSENILNNQ